MNRRQFLGAIFAAATAPAFVRYGSLMAPRPLTKTTGLVAITQDLLDSSVNIEELVRKDLENRLRVYLNQVFVNGIVGSDDNDGSRAHPLATLVAASKRIGPESTVFVDSTHIEIPEGGLVIPANHYFSNCNFVAKIPGGRISTTMGRNSLLTNASFDNSCGPGLPHFDDEET